MGFKFNEIDELVILGCKASTNEFEGKFYCFPPGTKITIIGPYEKYQKESGVLDRLRNIFLFVKEIIANRKKFYNIDFCFASYFEYLAFIIFGLKIIGTKAKIITNVIGDYPTWNYAKHKNLFFKWYLLTHQKICQWASDEVWFISDYLQKLYGNGQKNEFVIHNSPISEKQIGGPKGLTSDTITLVFVGRFEAEKSPQTVFYAADILKKRGVKIVLKIVGSGSLTNEIKNLARDLNLMEETEFYGRVYNRKKIFELFRGAHFFIFPSLHGEGFPFVTMEAMSQGVVIVTTPSGGVPEIIIDGKTGILVSRIDDNDSAEEISKEIADAIYHLIVYPELYAKISALAVERAKELTIEKFGIVQRRHIQDLLRHPLF